MNIKLSSHLAVALLAAGIAVASPASAQLRIDVSGTAGTNKTLWTFSGSSIFSHNSGAGFSEAFLDSDRSPSQYWYGPDWMVTDISNDDREFLPGSTVTISIGARTETVETLELDNRANGRDEFGMGTNTIANDWDIFDGDLISWAGQGEIDVDITEFISGSHNFSDWYGSGTLNMTMNISNASSVPEPGEWAAMGILGAGLAGLVIRKRRQA